MAEEFKPIRITLSEEAYSQMEKIMTDSSFRSYSSTIEECIRATHDIIAEIQIVAGKAGEPVVRPTFEQGLESLNRIVMRMCRFTGRIPTRQDRQDIKDVK
jgi:hypothetical protein